MRNFILNKWLLAVLFLLMPSVASAAGLGRLAVLSNLGQPFHAEIELVSVQKEEEASLSVRLASPDAYRQANLQYNTAVAGLRFSIEKRPNGQPYIKITSERPVSEFIVDILVELNWAAGRLMREYRALLDPPGLEPAPVAVPELRPAPAAQALAAEPVVAGPVTPVGSYGPIQRGETLSKIARGLKPEGVTVEQMLLGLFRTNPEAFIRKNMNLVRTGKILRVPEQQALAAISQREAVKEYRAQVADWNAYRRKLADAAGMAPEGRTAASGRITARVEDKASAEAKDVVRLSKGEPPAGVAPSAKPRSAAERIRSLEEEVIAKEKALSEANERIAQLEKTIKDMQRLAEIKSPALAAAQQQAEMKAAPKPDVAPKPEAVPKPEAAKPEAKAEAAKPAPPPAEKPVVQAKPEAPKPKPKAAPPPPPPEPELIDIVMENLPLIGAGGGAILLGGLGFWYVRRRRAQAEKPEAAVRAAPTLAGTAPAAAQPAVTPAVAAAAAVAPAIAPAVVAEVDPLEEARVYLAHGRDAQAEATLKEALAKEPQREDIQVKLLEIYAARKDKTAFGKHATGFNKLTGGQGENWLKVAAMGFALDPQNRLYAAGKDVPTAAPLAAETQAVDLDFNLDLAAPAAAGPDITLDAGAEQQPAAEQPVEPVMPDFQLEVPAAAETTATAQAQAPASEPPALDFNIELPKIEVPGTPVTAPSQAEQKRSADVEFKLDLGDINLTLDDKAQGAAAAGGAKDAHWYDVQAKFDLAKAYQEMGDKAGAKEILQEVVKEGDAEQQAEAKALLDSLG